jgi:hypothetical protein
VGNVEGHRQANPSQRADANQLAPTHDRALIPPRIQSPYIELLSALMEMRVRSENLTVFLPFSR